MYIINTVTVKINPSNYNHFSKYINDISIGELVDVNIDILNKGSHTIISVKCDECGKEKDIKYNQYQKNYKNGDYLCVSCKRKKNNKEKYGVENVFQLETTKKNIKETNISKYGVENVSQLEEIKKKKEETCMKKHGSKHHLQNKDILQKQKKTNLEKYGVDNVSKLDIVKSKKNAKHYDKDAKIRLEIENKRKKTNLEKYNVEYTLQNFDTKEKIKETCLKKY